MSSDDSSLIPRQVESGLPVLGESLGEFELKSLLSDTGYARFFGALWTARNKPVTVMVLEATNEHIELELKKSVSTIRSLNHPGLPKTVDLRLSDNGFLFVLMEELKGVSLRELLDSSDSIEREEDIFTILSQVLNLVKFLHENGLVHSDLRPETILLEESNESVVIRIVGAGLARVRPELRRAAGEDEPMSSYLYKCPQLLNQVDQEGRTDLYAIGILAYELATGTVPLRGSSLVELLELRRNENATPVEIKEYRGRLKASQVLDDFVRLALAAGRPGTVISVPQLETLLESWIEAVRSDSNTASSENDHSNVRDTLRKSLSESVRSIAALRFVQQEQEETLAMKFSAAAAAGARLSPGRTAARLFVRLAAGAILGTTAIALVAFNWDPLNKLFLNASGKIASEVGFKARQKHEAVPNERKMPSIESPLVKQPEKLHESQKPLSEKTVLSREDLSPDQLLIKRPYYRYSNPSYGVTNNMPRDATR